jgi:pimeloyl-ACP methyl ester carboxylesterase
MQTTRQTTTTTKVPVGDIEIACTVLGDGPPLVVLHGAIGLGSAYMRSLDPWADEVRLVHYDQRASGQTPVGDVRQVSFAGGVEDLEGLRRGLGLERVAVLGHSAGAYLAALYAAEHPDRTDAAVLLNPGPPLAPDLMQEFGAAMTARRTPADDEARRAIEDSPGFRNREPEALERHQLNTFLPFFRDRASVDGVDLGFTEITAANVQEAPARMVGGIGALEPMRRFAAIACPTLVVHGERDPIPVAWSRLLAATIPGAELAVIEAGSHFPMVEDADRLRTVVLPWLAHQWDRLGEST